MNAEEYISELNKRYVSSHHRRIDRLERLAQDAGVSLRDVEVVLNRDPRWNKRRNRTEEEARARLIGQTNDTWKGYPKEIVWAYVTVTRRNNDAS